MHDDFNLGFGLVIWVIVIVVVVASRWRKGATGAGLSFAFLAELGLIHWPAAALYLLPWYLDYTDIWGDSFVKAGFQQSTYAVIAFGIGSVILVPLLVRLAQLPMPTTISRSPDTHPAKSYMVIGLLCFLALRTPIGRIPTVNALVGVGAYLLVVGLGLSCWAAWQARRYRVFVGWLLVALSTPFFTVLFLGFFGLGAMFFLMVVTFVSSFVRPRWKFLVAAVFLAYLGISLYGTYSRDRNLIREVVWSEETSLGDRIDQLYLTLSNIEWFDPFNPLHLLFIDQRLNMNLQVGQAVDYLASGNREYALGQTLWWSVVGMIPRAVWPGKPVIAGGSDLVTYYTGIEFGEGTSVGLGLVTEFYINFGSVGVVLGFLCLGIIVAVVDSAAGQRLSKGDLQGFALWFLPGVALLNVGGSLVELTSGAGAAVIMAMGVNKYIRLRLRDKKVLPAGVGLGQEKQPGNARILLPRS